MAGCFRNQPEKVVEKLKAQKKAGTVKGDSRLEVSKQLYTTIKKRADPM